VTSTQQPNAQSFKVYTLHTCSYTDMMGSCTDPDKTVQKE